MDWDFSCRDWRDRILEGRSLIPTLPLFEENARKGLMTFNKLKLPDVLNTPTMEEAAGPWFKEIVTALFGSMDSETNTRHIREIFALVPKGNSKTSYSAGLMIVALLQNIRRNVEYLFIAPTQAIAETAFQQALGMIEADDFLSKRFHIREHRKEIVDRLTKARLKIKTFDRNVLTGSKPAGVLLDELHLLGRDQHAPKVIRQIRGGLEKNTDGFLIFTTTQSDEPPVGAFRDELKNARAIRDGEIEGRSLPILYEFPESIADDQTKWSDPAYWHMVMPNLGRSLRLDSLQKDFESEKKKGEHQVTIWASQHLNIEVGLALKSDNWAGARHWLKQSKKDITLHSILERCEVVVAGIDGGGLDDLLGLGIAGRERGTGKWLLWNHAWMHESVLELRQSEVSRFMDLVQAGDLTIVSRMDEAFGQLADYVESVEDSGLLATVGLDPVGVSDIVDELATRKIGGDKDRHAERVMGISQGWKLSGVIKNTEGRLSDGKIEHGGQPLMTWCVSNAKIELTGNAVRVTKQASGVGKIDPLMAAFNAFALLGMNPKAKGKSAGQILVM